MFHRRAAIVFAVSGLALPVLAQFSPQQAEPSAPAAQAGEPSCPPAPSAEKLLSRLSGSFEGTVQIRDGKQMSGSMVSLAAAKQSDGSVLISFDGFIRQEKAHGLMRLSQKDGAFSMMLADSRYSQSMSGRQKSLSDERMVFLSEAGDLKHVVRIQDERLIVERFALSKDGQETLMFSLDGARLAPDQQVGAAAHLKDAKLLARVGMQASQPAVASAPEE